MKRILALGISTLLAVPAISATLVFAENGGTNSTSGTSTNTTVKPETHSTPGASTQPAGEDSKTLQMRLDQRTAELKVKLSGAEKLNIQTKCKAAQGLVSSVKGRVNGLETSHSEVYTNIVTHLTDLSLKLKNKGLVTTALDADIAILKTKITTFDADLAAYKLAVGDLTDMDCKTNPDGFKASLMAARSAQETVSKDAQGVRAYVNDTIKPLLKTIRTELETKKTGGNQ